MRQQSRETISDIPDGTFSKSTPVLILLWPPRSSQGGPVERETQTSKNSLECNLIILQSVTIKVSLVPAAGFLLSGRYIVC